MAEKIKLPESDEGAVLYNLDPIVLRHRDAPPLAANVHLAPSSCRGGMSSSHRLGRHIWRAAAAATVGYSRAAAGGPAIWQDRAMETAPHLLVVDDHRDIREPLARYLTKHGFRVSTAENAAAARKILQGAAIDLLVLDIMMPGEDGLALCRQLRAQGDLPIVLLTALGEETDRIVKLVERMEAFGDGAPIERRPVNIHQVLEHVRRLAESGFARHVRFVELYDPSLPEVEGDRDRLVQAFLNLVKNAAEAVPAEGGVITLSTHYRHGVRLALGHARTAQELPIVVEVKDNGPGVPPDLEEHLFEPFVTTKPKGRGLGLALVAKVVADHGGVVSLERGDPGTIARVRLPAAPRPRRPGEAEAGA